jgi:hypothetical protein
MEDVTVTNHLHRTSEVRVALEVDADFADCSKSRTASWLSGM